MSLIIITAPSVEPVTLAEAKLHCKVDGTDDDTRITILIKVARQQAEHRTGRALCTQTLEKVLDVFPDDIKLPMPPAKTIVSVKYLDTAGAEQTLAANTYSLDKDSEPGWLTPAYGLSWPDTYGVPNAVRVRYTCGYGAAADVPDSIGWWIRMAIKTMYDENTTEVPRDFFAGLLDPYWVPQL